MNNSYKFAADQTSEMSKRIDAGATTSILGIPGAGITLFLKHLAYQPLGNMVYLDVFSLPGLTSLEFYRALLEKLGGESHSENVEEVVLACKKQMESLVKKGLKTVICVAGFDQLQPEFTSDFFRHLRNLRATNPSKIVFVFGICRRLETLLPVNITGIDLGLFSSVYYLKPYNEQDIRYLLSIYGPHTDLSVAEKAKAVALGGGHFQFSQLLLSSERRADPVKDPFIQLAFKNVYSHLNTAQKVAVRKLALSGSYPKQDEYLTNVGIVKKSADTYTLFSPLFTECIRTFATPKLPVKERRLLAILKRNRGRVVTKKELYDAVWHGDDIGSEWALNALIYRLRKHPLFLAQHYVIESHKKVGYILL